MRAVRDALGVVPLATAREDEDELDEGAAEVVFKVATCVMAAPEDDDELDEDAAFAAAEVDIA